MFPVTAVVNALPRVCVRRWCRQWTTCCDLRPWNHGRTWTAQSRPTLPPCYWTSWKKELSCLPTTCMGIAFQTEHPVLVRKKITSGGNYVEYMMVWPLFVELKFLLDVLWQRRGLKKNVMWFFFFFPPSDLEVHVLNTEMDLQDLSFPQNYASDSTIQLSASTIKQYSRNGQQPSRNPIISPEKSHCPV